MQGLSWVTARQVDLRIYFQNLKGLYGGLNGFSKVCRLDGLNTLLSQEAVSWKRPHRGNGGQNKHSENRGREPLRAQVQHMGPTVATSSR